MSERERKGGGGGRQTDRSKQRKIGLGERKSRTEISKDGQRQSGKDFKERVRGSVQKRTNWRDISNKSTYGTRPRPIKHKERGICF